MLGFLLAAGASSRAQDQKPLSVGDAKFQLDVYREEARRPLRDLQDKYEQALEKLAKTEQEQGRLDAYLATQEERKQFRGRNAEPDKSPYPSLESLRTIYREELDKALAEIAKSEIRLLGNYISHLKSGEQNLTREGRLDEALAVRSEIDSTWKEIEALKTTGAPLPATGDGNGREVVVLGPGGAYDKRSRIEVVEDGKNFVLTSPENNTRVESRTAFKTPFRLTARVATDSTNIRFYFAQKGIVIFNWEMKRDELRLNEPVSGKKYGIKKQGEVDTGKMHDLEIKVTKDKVEVYADRRRRADIEGDFAAAEGTIGLGPAFGSTLTVESFQGIQEETESR